MKNDALAKLDNFDQALAKADTFEGVKNLHDIAAAAEAFARAANLGLEPQNYAAEKRLRASRKAGSFLSKLEKRQGKRTDLTLASVGQGSDYSVILDRTGTSRADAKRWQTIAAAAESLFDQLIEEGKRLTELTTSGLLGAIKSGKWHPILSSGEDNWWTPKKYMDAIREVMGAIDLDPASCAEANKTVQAAKYYDRKTNGINKIWEGRIFLNPPYGTAGPEFIEKFIHDFDSTFHEGIILVNSRATDADWFQPMFNGVICFTDHRIDFNSPAEKKTSSTHGSCFIYFGPNEKKFAEVFAQFGNIVKRWANE